MGMAVLSPCPLLVNDTSGGAVMVSWTSALLWVKSSNEHKSKICNHKPQPLYPSCFCIGVGLDLFYSLTVLCEGDHWPNPARWRPQRSRVVWSRSAVRFSAGSHHHVSSGQCVWLVHIRRPMQHKMSLNLWLSCVLLAVTQPNHFRSCQKGGISHCFWVVVFFVILQVIDIILFLFCKLLKNTTLIVIIVLLLVSMLDCWISI